MDSLEIVTLLVGWVAGFVLFWRCPTLATSSRAAAETRAMSVIIPARNEATTLPTLLKSLQSQSQSPGEIIVVNDHSTDDTAAIAASFGVTVIDAPPLPDGWAGKPWACHVGATAARGSTFVFLDADTCLAPTALSAIDARLEEADLVSVQPHHVPIRAYERLSSVFNVVSVMASGVAAAGKHETTMAFGPCLAIRRTDYDAIGGHRRVAGQVVEDIAFARAATAEGTKVATFLGGDLIRFRMYPSGLRSLLQGWTKNFAVGATSTPPLFSALTVAWIVAVLSSISAVIAIMTGGPTLADLAVYAMFAGQTHVFFSRVGRFGRATAAAYPVVFVGFVCIFAYSLVRTYLTHTVDWKGRTLDVRASTETPANLGV